jgi:BirA family biotin operon repressor/biotin-[acetyl-CoA-carboxylase] ligase
MQNQSTLNARRNAQTLRREMTEGERRLWSRLRAEQLGVKFRRQHPLGNYIADFACLSPKLIVELDGSQHAGQIRYDTLRDGFFRAQGFNVLRFASNDAFLNLEGILSVIANALQSSRAAGPHPCLPPEGEGDTARTLS